ncbi:MAG: C-GCAxxG-C-C family protein [Oscillospiraceae bacterium]|nr:C-GCAxxG-C-C family protein [Oscillospiraceae bacterium]
MSERGELAVRLFDGGCNCAQAVFSVFSADYDIDAETALRLGAAFGAGAYCGELCGALSGAALVCGAKYGNSSPEEHEQKYLCKEKTAEVIDRFRRRFDCIRCMDLLGVNVSTPEGREIADREELREKRCAGFVAGAAEILEELGY